MYFIVVVIAIVVIVLFWKYSKKPDGYPLGPPFVPIFGSLGFIRSAAKKYGGRTNALNKIAENYETNLLGLKLGQQLAVYAFSSSLVKKVLLNDNLQGRPDNVFNKERALGKKVGITSSDGENWKMSRTFVIKCLKNEGFGCSAMQERVTEEALDLIKELEENKGEHIQVSSFIAPSIMNILWYFIAGKKIGRHDKKLLKFLDILRKRTKAFDMSGGILSHFPFLRFIAPEYTGFNLLRECTSNIREFIVAIIEEHKKTWFEDRRDDLIYSYLSEMYKKDCDTQFYNMDELIVICMDLFLGGSETTSTALDWLILLMIKHPTIKKKVQETLDGSFKPDEIIRYENRKKVPYIEAVIMESQRLRPSIAYSAPRAPIEDTNIEGYSLKKEHILIASLKSALNDPKVWINPDDFYPERFLNKNENLCKSDHHIPFGTGKRRCVGEALAKSAIFTIFCNIMKNFDIEEYSKNISIEPVEGIIESPQVYSVKFYKRM